MSERPSIESLPIAVTPLAIEHAKQKLREGPSEAIGLRVGVKGGGCSGFSYVYDYATQVRPGRDHAFEFEGLTLVIDEKSIELLRGATLDWETRLVGYGFKWRNPNAKSACGCGDSFEV